MNAVSMPLPEPTRKSGASLWRKAARKFGRDRLGGLALGVVLLYALAALGAWSGSRKLAVPTSSGVSGIRLLI